jgi:hypothetical protein
MSIRKQVEQKHRWINRAWFVRHDEKVELPRKRFWKRISLIGTNEGLIIPLTHRHTSLLDLNNSCLDDISLSIESADIFRDSRSSKQGFNCEIRFLWFTPLSGRNPSFVRLISEIRSLDPTTRTPHFGKVTHNAVSLIPSLSKIGTQFSHFTSFRDNLDFKAPFDRGGAKSNGPPSNFGCSTEREGLWSII